MTKWLAELRARAQVGGPTLLLCIADDDPILAETRRLLIELLRVTPLPVVDLGESAPDAGPRRWAELTRRQPGAVYVLTAAPTSPLSLRPMVTLYNTERELLRELDGPLLLVVSRATERAIRETSPDFVTWAAWTYEVPAPRALAALAAQAGVSPAQVIPPEPEEDPIRFLHLSDIHLRPQRVKRYDQDRVLQGLIDFLASDRASFSLDTLFVTGDLSQSGRPDEYAMVVDLLRKLMEVTGVPPERVFVVPGNHDVDRDVGRWLLRTLVDDEQATAFFELTESRVAHARKFDAYRKSMSALLGEGRPLGLAVGEEAVEILELRGARIAVASFNSAWFAQGDDDHGRLWLGEPSVNRAGQRVADLDAPFAVALMHHPLGDLHEVERDNVEHYLERSFDLVVRGHLHKDRTRAIATQRGGYVELAGPAAYQGSQWPNGCFLGEIRPRARKVRLRPYAYASGPDPWVLDTKVFPDDEGEGYCHTFEVPRKRRLKSAVTQGLERAVEEAVRTSPAAHQKVAEQLAPEWAKGVPSSVAAVANVARAHAGESVLLEELLSPAALGQALGRAASDELAKQEPISRDDPRFLEKALARVAGPLGRAFREASVERRQREDVITWMLHDALSAVLARPPIAVSPQLSSGARPDLFIGAPGEPAEKLALIELKSTENGPASAISNGLAHLDKYFLDSGAAHGALVLFGAHAPADAPIEHATTPAGRAVLLLRL